MPPVQPVGSRDADAIKYFTCDDPEHLFEDLREIGHGSFGAVYYARHIETKEIVAIKMMSYGGKKSQEKWKDIVQEVKILCDLQHRNTIQYKGCYLTDHTAWLVMEYCLGSASDVVEVHKCALKEEEISVICKDTLLALEYLHSLNFIHRDVKAGNILLTDVGLVKLADFGSASITSPANSFIGTPYWMAPEVILAMDDGEYTGNSDIWSLGITCIELAEGKPPLFNMNAMAALYHIPQNDPPTLADSHWSLDFRGFVEMCLQKDASMRPDASQTLKHTFIERYVSRSLDIISDLIRRTKASVREMDKKNARKIKKFLMEELYEDDTSLTESNGSLQNQDDLLLVDESSQDECSSLGGGSNSNSLCSADMNETLAVSTDNNQLSDSNSASSNQPIINRRPVYHNGDYNGLNRASQDASTNHHHHHHGSGSSRTVANRSRRYNSASEDNGERNFATIRTPSIVKKQKNEHAQDDLFKEQMNGYKRMRKQHQKELHQLEERQHVDLEVLKSRLSKEYDVLMSTFYDELVKLKKQHQQLKDKSLQTAQSDVDKLNKKLGKQMKSDMERFKKDLASDKKQREDDMKRSLSATPKKEKEEQIRTFKKSVDQNNERRVIDEQMNHENKTKIQVRKFQRLQLLGSHRNEEKLLKEELNKKKAQMTSGHDMLRRHHEEVQDLEYKHLGSVHKLREEQHKIQHSKELLNQREYTERQEKELRKRHALQTKQLPRSINENKGKLKKQLREALETQNRQYKARRDAELSKAPRNEHRNIIKRLKDEQEYKRRTLFDQYEQLMTDLVANQNMTLDESQIAESQELKKKLNQETELLMAYQSKIRIQTDGLHTREKKELQDRVSLRRAELEQRVEDELQKFNTERSTAICKLHERQAREIENFDQETCDLGIDPSDIYTADDEFKKILDDEQTSMSSMSISTSNSTASVSTHL